MTRCAAALLCITASTALAARAEGEEVLALRENLVARGLPPLPASIAGEVGRYTEFRSAAFVAWHPTRRAMLISTRFGEVTQLHWVETPGATRTQMTSFPEPVTSGAFPRHDPRYFVFLKDQGGDEFHQIYRQELDTGAVTLVSDGKRSQNGLGPFAHAAGWMAFTSTARNGEDRDVYTVDPSDPASLRRVLEVKGGGWGVLDISPDDATLLVAEEISVEEKYLWLVDVASGEKRLLVPKPAQGKITYGGARFAPDGASVFATSNAGSEFLALTRIDLRSGRAKALTRKNRPWDVDGFAIASDGKTIAFTKNERGASVLHLMDVASGTERPVPDLPVGVIGRLTWHENARDLAFVLSEPRSPGDAYSLDVTTGKIDRWTWSETAGIPRRAFPAVEVIEWPSFDGKAISGFLYRSEGWFPGKRPVMIVIHGGPEIQARPDFLGVASYYTNELGVALLYPNVRGSTGFGKTFYGLDNGLRREDSVKDIGALLDWIRTRPDLDADRVMITGRSYGGYMTLACAAQYSDRVRCFLDVVGISDFVTFLEGTEAYRRDLRRVEYGDERDPEMRAFLSSIAPLGHVGAMTKPMFIVQGKNDPRVPYTESEQMVAALEKRRTPVWYLMANDEGHGFSKKPNVDFLTWASVLFVKRHLLD